MVGIMGKGYLSVEKKSSADTVIRQDSHQDAPQVMRSRMTKEQQEAQMQQGARGSKRSFRMQMRMYLRQQEIIS